MRTKNPPEEHFRYLQKKRVSSPDFFGTLATLSVFRSNRFIRKGHSLSKSTLLVNPTGSKKC